MESLKELEELQRMMVMMESEGIIASGNEELSSLTKHPDDSRRFLANFCRFMTRPCGELGVDDRCRLISHHLPTISAATVEKGLKFQVDEKGDNSITKGGSLSHERFDKTMDDDDDDTLPILFRDTGLIGLDAMQRANSTLEDFCRSYFMFHGMDTNRPESVFKFLPILSFTESYIYQLDTMNEKLLSKTPSISGEAHQVVGNDASYAGCLSKDLESDPFKPLAILLEQNQLLTERIKEELRCGEEYWKLERKLCSSGSIEKSMISVEDVKRAIQLKSFDYRVLNLLLYQLRGQQVNELHMEFLSTSELLVEIADDLFDYEEDVVENSFNVLRMFVRLYGPTTAPTMLAKYITEVEEKYDQLLKCLDPVLATSYKRRCEEATREGGNLTGHPLGSWTIPPIIVDEEFYRSSNATPSGC